MGSTNKLCRRYVPGFRNDPFLVQQNTRDRTSRLNPVLASADVRRTLSTFVRNPPSHHTDDQVDERWKRTQPVTFDRALPTNVSDLEPGSRTNKRNYIHQQYSPSIQPPENLPLPTLVSRTAKKLATRPEHDMKSLTTLQLSVQNGLLKTRLNIPNASISTTKKARYVRGQNTT